MQSLWINSLSLNGRRYNALYLYFKAEDKIPSHYIKFIRDGVYEFRVACGNNELRIFFIYDGENVVVLFNCFRKKTQKTPDNEIKKAINLKKEYYEAKGNK